MTYYYTYKTTLLLGRLANHYYYGQHHTDNLDDGYCGSGLYIRKYFKKYTKIQGESYTKEIISFYDNADELNKAEYELIGDSYKLDPMCLNIQAGGYFNEWCDESRKKASQSAKKRPKREIGSMRGKHHSEESKIKISEGSKKWHSTHQQKHSEEAKQKIREKAIGRPSSFKGKHQPERAKQILSEKLKALPKRCWVYKDDVEYLIYESELDDYISNGYIKGRLLSVWGVNKTKKPDSEETRYKKGAARGKRWINNGIIQTYVYKAELNNYLENGWVLGYVKTNKNKVA